MRRRHLFLAGIVALLLSAAVLLSTVWLMERWRGAAPLTIDLLTVVHADEGVATLHVEGSGFRRKPDALLLPVPAFDTGKPRTLVSGTTLFQLESDGRLGVASARHRRLITLDVRDGQPPRILGSLQMKGGSSEEVVKITALAQVGTQVVVALSSSKGLALVDLADPAAPRKVTTVHIPGTVGEMLAINGRIYAAGLKTGLWQVTIDNGRLFAEQLPGPKDPLRLSSAGNRLVVANQHGDVGLYELGGGGPVRLVGVKRLPQIVRGVALGPDALHLCLADGTLREYDLSGWPHLALRGQLQLPGRPFRLVRDTRASLLFCNLIGVGVSVIDVSRAGAPTVAGWLPSPLPINDLVAVSGRLLTTNNNGLQIHKVDDLLHQQLTVEFPLGHRRDRAGLLNWRGAGYLYDQSRVVALDKAGTGQPRPAVPYDDRELLAVPGDNMVKLYSRAGGFGTMPESRGSLPVTGKAVDTVQQDGKLYVLSQTALHIFTHDRAGGYRLAGRLDAFVSAQSLALADEGFLLIGDRHQGVILVDVSDAAAPRVAETLRLPEFINKGAGGVHQVLVSGQRVFVARGIFGVQVLDLSGLPKLKTILQIDTPGVARQLALHDELLLVADRGQGIQIFDVRKEHPGLLATIPFPATIVSFIATAEELLMSNGADGLVRMPLPRRLSGARFDGDEQGAVALPNELPAGRYRLVLYDGEHSTSADFILN